METKDELDYVDAVFLWKQHGLDHNYRRRVFMEAI